MSKFIVFCADGTWNGPGQSDAGSTHGDITNVLKAYRALLGNPSVPGSDLSSEQEKVLTDSSGQAIQVAKYLDGVGDSSNPLVHAVGGGLGAGLIARVVRGYTFISRHYASGDKIVLLGFSRGAYTARALGELITGQGLLDATKLDLSDKPRAYALGCAAWRVHREATSGTEGLLEKLAEEGATLASFFVTKPSADQYLPAPIEAVAVWDTVGSLGIPDVQEGVNLDLFRFVDTKLGPTVAHGFHAVSADERRANFTPTLWDQEPRVVQVIFPGAHADVGGGYPTSNDESGLSDCALRWMVARLRAVGVALAGEPAAPFRPDAAGVAHAPWDASPWDKLPTCPRSFPPGLVLSQSVIDRLALRTVLDHPGAAAAPYWPASLGGYLTTPGPRADISVTEY